MAPAEGAGRVERLGVDDEFVAQYVAQHRDRMLGFLSVDPTQPDWEEELREGRERFGMRGIKLLPMYAGFRPDEARLDPLWKYATEKSLPVLLHTGTTFVAQAPLECTLPRHVDAVAIRLPSSLKFTNASYCGKSPLLGIFNAGSSRAVATSQRRMWQTSWTLETDASRLLSCRNARSDTWPAWPLK